MALHEPPEDDRPWPTDDVSGRAEPASKSAATVITLADLDKPLPPIPWVCQGLGLAPGAPTLIAGYGYSGKSVALQDMALSIVFGGKAWGRFDTAKGRVLHLDYEQGRRLTLERYQRIARARGWRAADHTGQDDDLHVDVMPGLYLDGSGAYDALARLFEKRSWCLIDSLRAAAPTADENASDIRRCIDPITRASEVTGCACSLIHHARKPSEDGAGGKFSVRGSGAIFDAVASVFIFEGQKGGKVLVKHEKDRLSGAPLGDFGLQFEDIPQENEPRWGLVIKHLEPEQMARGADKFAVLKQRILECVKANPNATIRLIRGTVRGSKDLVDEAVEQLEADGKLVRLPGAGTRGNDVYRAV